MKLLSEAKTRKFLPEDSYWARQKRQSAPIGQDFERRPAIGRRLCQEKEGGKGRGIENFLPPGPLLPFPGGGGGGAYHDITYTLMAVIYFIHVHIRQKVK